MELSDILKSDNLHSTNMNDSETRSSKTYSELFNPIPPIFTGLDHDEYKTDSTIAYNPIPPIFTGLDHDEYKTDSTIAFDSYCATANSSIFQSYTLSENTIENVNCNFVTLDQFLKKETTFESLEQLIISEKELAIQTIKGYFQKYVTIHEYVESVQLISFVIILISSIFSQKFGGNRSLPVA